MQTAPIRGRGEKLQATNVKGGDGWLLPTSRSQSRNARAAKLADAKDLKVRSGQPSFRANFETLHGSNAYHINGLTDIS
jgi:hypothetical protein